MEGKLIIVIVTAIIVVGIWLIVTNITKTRTKIRSKIVVENSDKIAPERKPLYHIKYSGTVSMGIDFEELQKNIKIDKNNIIIKIPELKIECNVDKGSLDNIYESNAEKLDSEKNVKRDFYICEQDMKKKVKDNTEMEKIAKDCIKQTIEGLLLPITMNSDYRIKFEDN